MISQSSGFCPIPRFPVMFQPWSVSTQVTCVLIHDDAAIQVQVLAYAAVHVAPSFLGVILDVPMDVLIMDSQSWIDFPRTSRGNTLVQVTNGDGLLMRTHEVLIMKKSSNDGEVESNLLQMALINEYNMLLPHPKFPTLVDEC